MKRCLVMSKKISKPVVLIGFSGSGKTTIAPLLAKRLGYTFLDVDSAIERKCKKSITRIFADEGEYYFRDLEREYITKFCTKPDGKVIALGGGAVMDNSSWRLLKNQTITIYLKCSQRVLYERLKKVSDRPLLAGNTHSAKSLKTTIKQLFDKREIRYKEADITVTTSHLTSHQTIRKIADKLHTYEKA